MNVALLGDMALLRMAATTAFHASASNGPLRIPSDCAVTVAHLGCPITRSNNRWERTPRRGLRRAPAELLPMLHVAGVRMLSMADDRVLDYETDGLHDTLRELDDAGIAHTGAGMDVFEAITPAVVEAGGSRLGLISFTECEASATASVKRPGVSAMVLQGAQPQLDAITTSNFRARRRGADIVVLMLHRSISEIGARPVKLRELAREALGIGVDLVVTIETLRDGGEHFERITIDGRMAGGMEQSLTMFGADTDVVVVDLAPGRLNGVTSIPSTPGAPRAGMVSSGRHGRRRHGAPMDRGSLPSMTPARRHMHR